MRIDAENPFGDLQEGEQAEGELLEQTRTYAEDIISIKGQNIKCNCERCNLDYLHLVTRPENHMQEFEQIDFSRWDTQARNQICTAMCPCGERHFFQLTVSHSDEGTLTPIEDEMESWTGGLLNGL